MRVPHPIPYQGSKRGLADKIVAYFPPGFGKIEAKVVEPFAGSAALSLAASHSGKAGRFLINDTNAALIALWQIILTDPELIAEQYRHL